MNIRYKKGVGLVKSIYGTERAKLWDGGWRLENGE
jgi:hypothetical protein